MASEKFNDFLSYDSIDDDSSFDTHVLLVDDDAATLAIVGAILRGCKYEVMTTNSSHHALEILRGKKDWFDLVVCDLHMPVMNGFELLIKIKEEFQIAVIMISADDNMSVMAKSLQYGASFFLTKPVRKDDIKYLWQYAVTAKKERPVVAKGIGMGEENNDDNLSNKRKPDSDATGDQPQEAPVLNKKKRMIWTPELHDLFLDAIKQIGLRTAVPKHILELMNVPGLTRAHVSSHLQKYRQILRRLSARNSHDSCFTDGVSPQLLGNSPTTVRQSFGKQPLELACQGEQHGPGMEPNMYASQDLPSFPNLQQTSDAIISMPHLQYDKSSDAASGADQLLFPDQLQACNSTGNSANDVLVGIDIMNTWPDMTHAKPSSLDNTSPRQYPLANRRSVAAGPMNFHVTNENSNLAYAQEKQNFRSVGVDNLGWNSNPPRGNNYSGSQNLNAGTGLKEVGLATGSFNRNHGMLNETENGGTILAPMGSGASGYMLEEDSSSGQGLKSASQLLPTGVTNLPTQLEQQYGPENSGGINDIVTNSMISVDNPDEEELDGDELIRYFLDLEKHWFYK